MSWIAAEEAGPDREADALVEMLRDDPRRIVAIVGELERVRALARKVAGRCGGQYAGEGADVRALVLTGDMPVVVLDGDLAPLAELATRRLHPRLKVIVPCDPGTAPELPERAMVARGSILVAVVDPEQMPEASPNEIVRTRPDKAARIEALAAERAQATEPRARARAGAALASLTRDPELAEAAVADARLAGDPGTLADALILVGDLRGGTAHYDEAADVHDADGAIGRAAMVRGWAAAIAGEAADYVGACARIVRVIDDRLALGDVLGAALALGRQARWELELGRVDAARRCAEQAADLAAAIDDPRGLGYAEWFLGALAERGGDGVTAMRHYEASLEAYAALGDVPERVIESLATLRRAYDGTAATHDDPAPLPPADLIPLGRRS